MRMAGLNHGILLDDVAGKHFKSTTAGTCCARHPMISQNVIDQTVESDSQPPKSA